MKKKFAFVIFWIFVMGTSLFSQTLVDNTPNSVVLLAETFPDGTVSNGNGGQGNSLKYKVTIRVITYDLQASDELILKIGNDKDQNNLENKKFKFETDNATGEIVIKKQSSQDKHDFVARTLTFTTTVIVNNKNNSPWVTAYIKNKDASETVKEYLHLKLM